MFRKLRNKLILTNLGITTLVVLVVFSAIYVSFTNSAKNRPPIPDDGPAYTTEIERIISNSVQTERDNAAIQLLINLSCSGVLIEIAVALISYFLAEQAIQPVREAYESQKVFIANASHEIKTPLAAISANLEAADIKGNRWINNVEKETEKLTALNNELLALARTDLVASSTPKEVELKEFIEKLIASFEPRMGEIKFSKEILFNGTVKIAKTDFAQVFGILMDNAIKYCDKEINLVVSEHELKIENDGAKIKSDKLEHVFERFYQVDKSAEGVGLGLSIAKATAERNNWSLVAESDEKTRFILKF